MFCLSVSRSSYSFFMGTARDALPAEQARCVSALVKLRLLDGALAVFYTAVRSVLTARSRAAASSEISCESYGKPELLHTVRSAEGEISRKENKKVKKAENLLTGPNKDGNIIKLSVLQVS